MSKSKQPIEEELTELRRLLLEMGIATEEMVGDSVQALLKQNIELANSVIDRDERIDRMERDVEIQSLRLLARKAISNGELWQVTGALKIATDIERIADHAVDIAKIAKRLTNEVIYKPLVDIPYFGEVAQSMLRDTLDALVRQDKKQAPQLIAADDQADALYKHMVLELQNIARNDPHSVTQATYLLFVAHYLERIGDHCTNIAERVAIPTGKLSS